MLSSVTCACTYARGSFSVVTITEAGILCRRKGGRKGRRGNEEETERRAETGQGGSQTTSLSMSWWTRSINSFVSFLGMKIWTMFGIDSVVVTGLSVFDNVKPCLHWSNNEKLFVTVSCFLKTTPLVAECFSKFLSKCFHYQEVMFVPMPFVDCFHSKL